MYSAKRFHAIIYINGSGGKPGTSAVIIKRTFRSLFQVLRWGQVLFVREQNSLRIWLRREASFCKYGVQSTPTLASQEADVYSTCKYLRNLVIVQSNSSLTGKYNIHAVWENCRKKYRFFSFLRVTRKLRTFREKFCITNINCIKLPTKLPL